MNEFYDPFLYDLNIGPGSRVGEIYLAEAQQGGGPILELGCGTGDVLLPIARSDLSVVGIDSSRAMLDRFRERLSIESSSIHKSVELVEGRMESFSLGQTFQQIFIPNDGIAHLLDESSLKRTLENSHRHLNTGGRLILDISLFDVQYLGRFVGNERELLRDQGNFPLPDGGAVHVWEQTAYDQDTGILTATFRYEFLDNSGKMTNTYYRRLRLYPRRPSEVALATEVTGFKKIEIEPLIQDGKKLGLILRTSKI